MSENIFHLNLSPSDLGKLAEKKVKKVLVDEGFTILGERFKTPFAEVDLIARKEDLVVVLEIKAHRRPWTTSAEVLRPFQWRRLQMAQRHLAGQFGAGQSELSLVVLTECGIKCFKLPLLYSPP